MAELSDNVRWLVTNLICVLSNFCGPFRRFF